MKNITEKPASLFPDNSEAVLVRQNQAQRGLQINLKCFQQVAMEFKWNFLLTD